MFTTAVGVKERSRAFQLTVAVSIAVHVAAGLGLLVASFWKITRLTPKTQELVFQTALPAEGSPQPPSPPRPAAAEPRKPDPSHIQKIRQPTKQTQADEPSSAPATSNETPNSTGSASDDPGVPVGSDQIGGPVGLPDEVGAAPVEVPPPPPKAPQNVTREEIEAQRISGDPQIHLPDSVLSMLRSDGVDALRVNVVLCVDEQGAPASIRFTLPSGYEKVDETIRTEMAGWRYRPWRVNGAAARACFPVAFKYRITQ